MHCLHNFLHVEKSFISYLTSLVVVVVAARVRSQEAKCDRVCSSIIIRVVKCFTSHFRTARMRTYSNALSCECVRSPHICRASSVCFRSHARTQSYNKCVRAPHRIYCNARALTRRRAVAYLIRCYLITILNLLLLPKHISCVCVCVCALRRAVANAHTHTALWFT